MTKDENSLLLYLETRAVDYSGRIDQMQMNDGDRRLLAEWSASGFVETGRICFKDVTAGHRKQETNWVRLSEVAFQEAHRLRRERAERCWKNKTYKTTQEKRQEKSAVGE